MFQMMTSYQVMCSVTRPPEPTSLCFVTQFQDKAQRHINAVFQDHALIGGSSSSPLMQRSNSDAVLAPFQGEEGMLCALASKTSASFSGIVEDSQQKSINANKNAQKRKKFIFLKRVK